MGDSRVVLLPMKIDAYVNYGPDRQMGYGNNPDRAYLSPITQPNFEALKLDSDLIQHDIFDHHRTAPYRAFADRYRLTHKARCLRQLECAKNVPYRHFCY